MYECRSVLEGRGVSKPANLFVEVVGVGGGKFQKVVLLPTIFLKFFSEKTGENFSIFFRQWGSILLFLLSSGGIFLIFLPTTGDSDPVLTSDGEVRHSFDWTDDPDK